MVVAMAVTGVMQVTVDQVVDVVSVGDGLVPAAFTVNVPSVVSATGMMRRAAGWIGVADLDDVLVAVLVVGEMKVPVMEIIDVVAMFDRRVAAPRAVDVIGMFVGSMVMSHGDAVAPARVWSG